MLLTSGEQVTSALIAGALNDLGIKSKSWMNWQIPIITEGEHSNARIIHMNIKNINLNQKLKIKRYMNIYIYVKLGKKDNFLL